MESAKAVDTSDRKGQSSVERNIRDVRECEGGDGARVDNDNKSISCLKRTIYNERGGSQDTDRPWRSKRSTGVKT